MSYTSITKRSQGTNVPKSFLDAIIDNLTYFYNLIGGSGAAASTGIQNGSFENDTDEDGIPDSWTMTYYTGGTGAYDTTTPMHGAKSWTFVSPGGAGNGGGYADPDDYTICAPGLPLRVDFILRSSADGVHIVAQVLWYDAAKEYLSTTTLYDRETSNPATAARLGCIAVPPAGALYCKVRLTGCKNDNTTAGTVAFDAVSVASPAYTGTVRALMGELTRTSTTWATVGTVHIFLPVVSSDGHIRLTFQAEAKNTSSDGQQRFLIGTFYSNEISATTASYVKGIYTIDLLGASGGDVILEHQLIAASGTTYGKKVIPEIMVEVIHA